MKKLFLFIVSISLFSCSTYKTSDTENSFLQSTDQAVDYANTITANDLKKLVYDLASTKFEGRRTGEIGQKLAAKYIADYYKNLNIKAAQANGNYFQIIPESFLNGKSNDDTENVIAFIKGSTFPNEIIVISAHYDHLGIKNGKIYYGADDNGSGTSAVLEIAEAFKIATNNGYRAKRSILFLNLTGEEEGLFGSKFYTLNPIYPLQNTVANLNIDMVGRIDKYHTSNLNYVYVIGSNKLSSDLHNINEEVNKQFAKLTLDYRYDDEDDSNRFYYRSDHYNFAKHNIPIIFYFNGVHRDYHKPSDTPDKINYKLLAKRARLVFYTAWEIANRKKRLIVDKN